MAKTPKKPVAVAEAPHSPRQTIEAELQRVTEQRVLQEEELQKAQQEMARRQREIEAIQAQVPTMQKIHGSLASREETLKFVLATLEPVAPEPAAPAADTGSDNKETEANG